MTTVTRRFQFCCGHTVYGHESKCANLHGHNYVALVTCQADQLDNVGRVIDFSVIKHEVGSWIDRTWDHRFLVFTLDPRAQGLVTMDDMVQVTTYNPTAENMAQHMLEEATTALRQHGVDVVRVELWETENCHAEVVA